MISSKKSEKSYKELYLEQKEAKEKILKQIEHVNKITSSALHSMEYKIKAFEYAMERGTATQEDLDALKASWQCEVDKMNENSIV